MMDMLQRLVQSVGVGWIAVTVTGYAAATAMFTLCASALALRAKRRANYAIRRAITEDAEFRALLCRSADRPLTTRDVQLVSAAIKQHLQELSGSDRRFVNAGLHQNSTRGLERFIGEVVGHKFATSQSNN